MRIVFYAIIMCYLINTVGHNSLSAQETLIKIKIQDYRTVLIDIINKNGDIEFYSGTVCKIINSNKYKNEIKIIHNKIPHKNSPWRDIGGIYYLEIKNEYSDIYLNELDYIFSDTIKIKKDRFE